MNSHYPINIENILSICSSGGGFKKVEISDNKIVIDYFEPSNTQEETDNKINTTVYNDVIKNFNPQRNAKFLKKQHDPDRIATNDLIFPGGENLEDSGLGEYTTCDKCEQPITTKPYVHGNDIICQDCENKYYNNNKEDDKNE